MTKLIYAEPDDEITNLVDRLRSEKGEQELVFVLPPASRVMHSGLNARLLMQYSNSLGKTSSIVSPDPRTQSIAIDTGFKVFPSVSAYETGGALEHPHDAAAAGPTMAAVPNDWNADPGRAARRASRTPVAAAAGVAGAVPIGPRVAARSLPRGVPTTAIVSGAGRRAWILGGLALVAVVLIAVLVVLPAATVTVIISARPVSATPTVTGSTTAPAANDKLAVQTHLLQSQASQQQQFNTTGTKTIPGTTATGNVVFHNAGFFTVQFPAGVEVYTDSGVKFITNADSGPVDHNGSSPPIGVTARVADHTGNVGAGAINHITNNSDPNYTVTNPQPTASGTDPQNKQIVSQADLDNAKKTLGDPLTAKVQQDLASKTAGLKLLPETQGVDVAVQADRKAGDEAPNFTATVTANGHATTVDDAKVKQALRQALLGQVPAGYTLTDDPLKIAYKLASHDDTKGTVVFDSSASGFMATAIDAKQLQSQLAGKSPKAARDYIRGHVDATDIIIHESPSFIPYLPLLSGRIDIKRQVDQPLSTSP